MSAHVRRDDGHRPDVEPGEDDRDERAAESKAQQHEPEDRHHAAERDEEDAYCEQPADRAQHLRGVLVELLLPPAPVAQQRKDATTCEVREKGTTRTRPE